MRNGRRYTYLVVLCRTDKFNQANRHNARGPLQWRKPAIPSSADGSSSLSGHLKQKSKTLKQVLYVPNSQMESAAALFRTANLNLAAYLVASNRLALDHVEPHVKHSEFYFRDSDGVGPSIAAEFITKDLKSLRQVASRGARILAERDAAGRRQP